MATIDEDAKMIQLDATYENYFSLKGGLVLTVGTTAK